MEDYKQLWFNVCEEKKNLQLENQKLKKAVGYYSKESGKFERLFKQIQMKEWNRTGKQIKGENNG